MDLLRAARALDAQVSELSFGPPVTHVYNPLDYAFDNYATYVRRYGEGTKLAVYLGMNPGPWGMAQTGIPFGEVAAVRDWLGIDGAVSRPETEHPKRPIEGLDCKRSEVSGRRLWGAIREQYETPQRFFERFFIANYCPLSFMEQSGRNRTPDKLKAAERDPLFEACDLHLRRLVEALRPRYVIGIGQFAEKRAGVALQGMDVAIGRICHPSPANPRANAGWVGIVQRELAELGICADAPTGRRSS